ncbi:Crp/Fnr family transcriptional regulator [Actinomadura kijaniata]|uniref:CRP-like cAMP-binding protein n=1 Tax=Actinomadura namibiensis TaxID=182080 RepID=A0A7W3LVW2_ACTNM|nr:Crp/Fnr family transcriptional regulator [Actinomadura namibiensis]MBA8955265.1 CRP-like cAMP-binding protein [Actinomadura namibiensis]
MPSPSPRPTFWGTLGPPERAALRERGRDQSFPSRSVLVHEGDSSDHVMIIMAGWAKVSSAASDGHDVVLAVRGPGDLVAESALLSGRRRSATITALGPVLALVLTAERFAAFLERHPAAWQRVSDTFIRRLGDADHRLQAHVSASGGQRLAALLADLAELSAYHRPPGPNGAIEIGPPLSQEELGSWTDTSRETVARSLAVLRRRGLIHTGWRRITVLDVAGLRTYAASDLD